MDAQIKAPFLLTCNDRRLAADAGVGREVRATGAARAPVLVVLHVLHVAARYGIRYTLSELAYWQQY